MNFLLPKITITDKRYPVRILFICLLHLRIQLLILFERRVRKSNILSNFLKIVMKLKICWSVDWGATQIFLCRCATSFSTTLSSSKALTRMDLLLQIAWRTHNSPRCGRGGHGVARTLQGSSSLHFANFL